MNYGIDGNQVTCVSDDFIDLQQSHAGFGGSLEEAFKDYWTRLKCPAPVDGLIDWEMQWASDLRYPKAPEPPKQRSIDVVISDLAGKITDIANELVRMDRKIENINQAKVRMLETLSNLKSTKETLSKIASGK